MMGDAAQTQELEAGADLSSCQRSLPGRGAVGHRRRKGATAMKIKLRPGTPDDANRDYLPESIKGAILS